MHWPEITCTGEFCDGDRPGLADIALVPQAVNSERYRLDLSPYPTIARIYANCMKLDAFAAAHPRASSGVTAMIDSGRAD